MDYVKSNTNYSGKKFENFLQKYLKPMRKISDYFPNRAIELRLDIDGNKAQLISAPKKKPSTKTYFRIQKPAYLIARSNDIPDIVLTSTIKSTSESTLPTTPAPSSTTTYQDPEEKFISMKELKSIMGEFENEVKTGSFENKPLKTRDFWIALGMKYGLKCNDGYKQVNTEPKPLFPSQNNLQKILQILKEGDVMERNSNNPSSKENLHWFKIKVPKNV
ncbi:unnamed protein product, partial [Iphiclides podalirius]